MPEKTEEIYKTKEGKREILVHSAKASSKCKKIFKFFRNIRKDSSPNNFANNGSEYFGQEEKRKKSWDLEERREFFEENMKKSWSELPTTLQRKKEIISEEILSEFRESDSNEPEKEKTTEKQFTNVSHEIKNKNDKPQCEYFSHKKDLEENAIALKNATSGEEITQLSNLEKSINCSRKSLATDIILNNSVEVSLETIKTMEKSDFKTDDDQEIKDYLWKIKSEKNVTESTIDTFNKIDLLFEHLMQNKNKQTLNSCIGFDSENPDIFVDASNSLLLKNSKQKNENIEEISAERSASSVNLINKSSSSEFSKSEIHQQEMSHDEKKKGNNFPIENESQYYEKNVEITYVNEIIDAKPKKNNLKSGENNSEEKSCCEETARLLNEISKIQNKSNQKSIHYADLIFSQPLNTPGFFVNDHFKGDLYIQSVNKEEQKMFEFTEPKVVYEKIDFCNSTVEKFEEQNVNDISNKKEQKAENHSLKKEAEDFQQRSNFAMHNLTEEQKAKKRSAEAIAKELSLQIFSKRNQNSEVFENSIQENNTVTIPLDGKCNNKVIKTDPGEQLYCNKKNSEKQVSEIPITSGEFNEENQKEEEIQTENFGSNLKYFSVAEWREAVEMGSKRGISSVSMETIVEEPETDTSTKLTVREILRRFEELGNKHFNDSLCMTDGEKTATLKQIHQTLKCLEEKVKNFQLQNEYNSKQQQYPENSRINNNSSSAWTGRRLSQKLPHSPSVRGSQETEEVAQTSVNDGKHSLLQFAIYHFRQSPEKFEMLKTSDGSISGSLKVIESKNKKNKEKSKGGMKDSSEWTWKEQVELVKFTAKPIEQSLLQLDTPELSNLAVECFICLMRYMGDLPMPTDVSEVKCVYTILMHCHKFEQLRDEVYCQLMKQTTNNKSIQQESCQRGWRLFSIVAAYFVSSNTLKPFLFKYLETAAYDKRRAYHGTAMVCLQNLRKTFKYGGRKNVPSVEEITAISAGRNSKRQIYRLPGGTEKVVNTKSTTVVQDVIEELCIMINVANSQETEEFSVYCIVEGDTFTMPLAREEYILDVTTELHKNHQVFYLIFCRSVWYFPLRLDSQLYVEVVFNQIAPDYLEGLLLIMPGESLEQEVIYDISKIAALLHRAADMTQMPTMKETKFLLPKPALSVRDVKPSQWVNMVQSNWQECENLTSIQAKAQVLDVLSKWPLFGSSFFAVKKASEPKESTDHILALNRSGVHFIDLITHETLLHYPFSEVISTRKVKSEDGTLFLDMKCGNLMQQRITRLQTDQAHEISRLIRQYITMQQRLGPNQIL